jgi:hypothetical protein
LVEEHDPIGARVEVAADTGSAAGARPTVEDDRGLAPPVAANLPIHEVAISDVEHAMLVRFDFRVEPSHLRLNSVALLPGRPRERAFWNPSIRALGNEDRPIGEMDHIVVDTAQEE